MQTKILNFTAFIEQDEDGVFVASIPSVPGCYTQGSTYEQAIDNIKDALELCLEEAKSNKAYARKIIFPQQEKQEHFVGFTNIPMRFAFA